MENKIKHILFYLAFAILLLPLAVQKLHIIKSGELKGGFKPAPNVAFTTSAWLSGQYQEQKEKYWNDNVGLRPDMVRMIDQVDYSIFDICHAAWTVKGKDGHLFQQPYIDAYYGNNYMGKDHIRTRCMKMKAIQDTLAKLGKTFVLAYLPSKASYYPEYFPDDRITKKKTTNYQVYRELGDSVGINQVDLDAWFCSMKGKSPHPLFTKQGIHWTWYGALIGGDSLSRYMERLTGITTQHPYWNSYRHTAKLEYGDDDVAAELNMIFPITKEWVDYPEIKAATDTGRKINAIYIGDSYAHKMTEAGMLHYVNGQCEFWSYFDEVHDINGHSFSIMRDYDWVAAIDRADCVVLSYTLFNFRDLGNGFIQKAYEHYYPRR